MLVAAKLKAKKYAVVRNFHFNKELKCTCFDNTPCYMCSITRVYKKVCVPFFWSPFHSFGDGRENGARDQETNMVANKCEIVR